MGMDDSVSQEFRTESENVVVGDLEDGELKDSPVRSCIPAEEHVIGMMKIGVKRGHGEIEECRSQLTVTCSRNAGGKSQCLGDGVETRLEEGQISEEMEADMDLSDSSQEQDLRTPASRIVGFQDPHRVISQGLGGSTSDTKRQKIPSEDDHQASVHVAFTSLTRASKRKLEELLQEWSEWHVHHGSSGQDKNEVLESGQCTYFPALIVGIEKHSAVSFWVEKVENQSNNNVNNQAGHTVPYYDREYAVGLTLDDGLHNTEGGLEIVDDPSRCFNCGSYSHSLKDCDKPRDHIAVDSARKDHKLKKSQNLSSRALGRYYQRASGGKFDDLRPGALHSETRKVLGIEELDPPPWFNRMRELGYPPGYMDQDLDNTPSDITIFGDDEVDETRLKVSKEPKLKMSVEYPGINAPIPENANRKAWTTVSSAGDTPTPRSRLSHRLSDASDSYSRWHNHDDRWSANHDYDYEGPPGVDPPRRDPSSNSSPASYPPRYGGAYDLRQRLDAASGRFHSDRDRRSYLDYEDTPARHKRGGEEMRGYHDLDYYSRRSYESDRYRYNSSR